MKNQNGGLSIEFLFAIISAFAVFILLLSLSFTFVAVEVCQYIAYSTARTYSLAAVSPIVQEQRARFKYRELINNPIFKSFFTNGWIKVPKETEIEIKSGISNDSWADEYSREGFINGPLVQGIPYVGVRFQIEILHLDLNIGFLGNTNANDTPKKAFVTGFLIREPSMSECTEFMSLEMRYKRGILSLDSRFAPAQVKEQNYIPGDDNGC